MPSAELPEPPEAPEAGNARIAQKKQAAPLTRDFPPSSLDALPGNGTGASSPSGEDTQGPSPVDYSLEIEAEFPPTMVIELQRNAALRARKTVIGRTLAGRASFKELQDVLKLHLPAPFQTVTLLTRGYFEVLFEKEEGAKAARKLAAVEWSSWALSFSRYSALFRPNEHGAEMLLTHSIKVQFPDLHVQLRTEKALTIMASSIGEVLDIESPDSYIKRPAGPMVTVEVKDISKLAGIIRIPSMVEGAGPGDTRPKEFCTPACRINVENVGSSGTLPRTVHSTGPQCKKEAFPKKPPPNGEGGTLRERTPTHSVGTQRSPRVSWISEAKGEPVQTRFTQSKARG